MTASKTKGWHHRLLKRVVGLQSGDYISADEIEESGSFPVLGGNGLRGYCERFNESGDFVLVGRQGALCGNVNRAQGRFFATEHALVATPADQDAPVSWIAYLLEALNLNQYSQASAQPGISASRIGEVVVPVPPLEEQRRIADFLDAETARIDSLVAEYERQIELVEEDWLSTLFHGVTGRLTSPEATRKPTSIPWCSDLPEHYGSPRLSAFHSSQLGKMLNADAASGPLQARYIKNSNVRWDEFDLESLPTMHFSPADRIRCSLAPGDVLVCEGGEVGRSAVWAEADAGIYFQKAVHRVRRLDGAGNPRYLMYCLWAAASTNAFAVEGNRVTIGHLTGEQLNAHRFPWAPDLEQEHICETLDGARDDSEALKAELRTQIDHLTEFRQALITKAVTEGVDACQAA